MESLPPLIQPRSSPNDVDAMFTKAVTKPSKFDPPLRKIICRYGPGCTHMLDPAHREKFWHPRMQKLNDEKIKSHYICNECGYATSVLPDLALHLRRKTAWSNASLVGCRINCLVDCKEWHEGWVTQFHKSGKHFVEFRQVNEKRWLLMKKVAFYIMERPASADGSEYKDSGGEGDNMAPVEDCWVYAEDISLDYAFSQSVLFKLFSNSLQETGHLTKGHVCLTDGDKAAAQQMKISLLYGELLPRGANKAFGSKRLEAHRAASLYDLGMGTGKIIIQAFLQFKNLRYIFGVELSQGRYKLAEEAALRLVQLLGAANYNVQLNAGRSIIVTEALQDNSGAFYERVMHLQCGNMFDIQSLDTVDVVMMETDIPFDLYPQLQRLLASVKDGARVLSYLDLRRVWGDHGPLPYKQLEVNRNLADRYPTSWSVQRGHHFYLWSKLNHESSWGNLGLGAFTSSAENAPGTPTAAATKPATPISSGAGTGTGSGSKSTELDESAGRCLPFLRFRWHDRRKASKGQEDVDRAVIPVNGEGRRAAGNEAMEMEVGEGDDPGPLVFSPRSNRSKRSQDSSGQLSPRPGADPHCTIMVELSPNSQQGLFTPISPNDEASMLGDTSRVSPVEFPTDIRSRMRSSPDNLRSDTSGRSGRKKEKSKSLRSASGSPRPHRKSKSHTGSVLTSDSTDTSPARPADPTDFVEPEVDAAMMEVGMSKAVSSGSIKASLRNPTEASPSASPVNPQAGRSSPPVHVLLTRSGSSKVHDVEAAYRRTTNDVEAAGKTGSMQLLRTEPVHAESACIVC